MKLLAIDGNSIMNRAFYGIKCLQNSKGMFTNAVTGFMNIYLKETAEIGADCVAVAFDMRSPTFRHKANSSYKANRKGMPDELAMQMPIIKKLLTSMGVKIVECEGYEADDILGTLSKACADSGNECFIVTGDRDSFQLVSDLVTVRLATNKETKIYTPDRIMEEYGVKPRQMIEIKALMGDSSDNISGVKGIGEKTALNLIHEAGSVDGVYEKLDEMKLTPSVRKKLESGKDDAYDSRFLAEICLDAPIEKSVEFYKIGKADNNEIHNILSELEMFKLMNRLGISGEVNADEKSLENNPELENLNKFEVMPFDENIIEKMTDDKISAFVFDKAGNKLSVFFEDKIFDCDDKDLILKYFAGSCKKVSFEGRNAYLFAFENSCELKNLVFVCDIAGYLLYSQAKEYTVSNLCDFYKIKYRKDMPEHEDIASLMALYEKLDSELKNSESDKLYYDVELPLCEVLASMEYYGVRADVDGIKTFGEDLSLKIDELTQNIYDLAGEEFNIASPKQLGHILFEKLGLPSGKKTKTGYSTNNDVLESLSNKHPIVPMVMEYRTLTKLNSTYVEGLLKLVRDDGRLHSVFKQTETRTGRISSTEPNMQNIPVRKEIGRNMRKFFVAENGNVLVDADYSQIELRVLASVCGDENMQSAFKEGRDIHTSTAAQVFGLPEDFVLPEMRSAAKAVNFGIIYGIGAFSLSKDIGVSVAEAKRYIKSYLDNYPKVTEFMDKTVADGIKNGYVTTVFGRRRYIPELSSSNKNVQAFGKRAAMNAPIQGAAADIIKIAMVKVYKKLKEEVPQARLILQVHDELIIETPEDTVNIVSEILSNEMQNAVDFEVPLTVDVHSGKSWFIAKG